MVNGKLTIVQQNVCGRKIYQNEWTRSDFGALLDQLLDSNPDVLFLTEFYYSETFDEVKNRLAGYDFITPLGLSERDRKNKDIYASCVLILKKNKVRQTAQHGLRNMLSLRYICSRLLINEEHSLNTLLMYVPQTVDSPRERAKGEMLESAAFYAVKYSGENLFVGGDMNSDIDSKKTSCIDKFNLLYSFSGLMDTDAEKLPTWRNARLDYALASGNSKIRAKTRQIKTISDHRGLKTIIEFL